MLPCDISSRLLTLFIRPLHILISIYLFSIFLNPYAFSVYCLPQLTSCTFVWYPYVPFTKLSPGDIFCKIKQFGIMLALAYTRREMRHTIFKWTNEKNARQAQLCTSTSVRYMIIQMTVFLFICKKLKSLSLQLCTEICNICSMHQVSFQWYFLHGHNSNPCVMRSVSAYEFNYTTMRRRQINVVLDVLAWFIMINIRTGDNIYLNT